MKQALWDVIISGAGVAGTTLGYELAKLGFKTLILEKEVLPRYKACGGGLTLKTAKLFDFDLSPVIEDEINGVHLSFKMGKLFSKTNASILAYMSNRKDPNGVN